MEDIQDRDASIQTDPTKIAQIWREYFMDFLEATDTEVKELVKVKNWKIKNGKAAAEADRIRPEMMKYIGYEGVNALHNIIDSMEK